MRPKHPPRPADDALQYARARRAKLERVVPGRRLPTYRTDRCVRLVAICAGQHASDRRRVAYTTGQPYLPECGDIRSRAGDRERRQCRLRQGMVAEIW